MEGYYKDLLEKLDKKNKWQAVLFLVVATILVVAGFRPDIQSYCLIASGGVLALGLLLLAWFF